MAKNRKLKSIFRFLTRSKKEPEALARGLGIGIFVGFLPSIGFQILLAVFLAGMISGNRLAAAAGTFVTNPITTVPIAALSLWLGDLVLPGVQLNALSQQSFSWKALWESPGEIGLAFLVGCFILAILGGITSYAGMRVYYSRVRKMGEGGKK